MKFLEYSVAGIPTVASDVKPYADAIEHGKTGFLVKTSDEWFNAIMTCLYDKKQRYPIIANARKEILEQYDIREIAKVWKKVLMK